MAEAAEDQRMLTHVAHGMPATEYYAAMALSQSGMRDLAISPLHYWFHHVNPKRTPLDPTPEMKFGTAVHCLAFEGAKAFRERYACMLCEDDYPEALFTVEDIRGWLRSKGKTPSGTRKDGLIAQAKDVDANVQIWDCLTACHEMETAGKMLCLPSDWARIHACVAALDAEPQFRKLITNGEPEVSIFDTDPDTGVPLKCRIDWMAPKHNVDLKTFTLRRGKSVDDSIADIIYYEGYYRQAYLYSVIDQRAHNLKRPKPFVIPFVQSDPPHEVRIREFLPTNYEVAALNVYWQKAQIDVRYFCGLWRKYMDEFGIERPWWKPQEIDVVRDEELRGMAYGV